MTIVTLTGESGSGKSTIANYLLRRDDFSLVTSSTTRKQRESDLPKEYEYLTDDTFNALDKGEKLIWSVNYAGNSYGTRYSYLDEAIACEDYRLMILVPEAVEKLAEYTSGFVPFFIRTPSKDILRARLQKRGDSQVDITKRLADVGNWETESSNIPYLFVSNEGRIETAVRDILQKLKIVF